MEWVFEQDPINPSRTEVGVRVPVARALEGVEGVRAACVLIACGEVGVHEAVLHEAAVHRVQGAAVEVPRDENRRVLSVTLQ
jgi:hypothetical protein